MRFTFRKLSACWLVPLLSVAALATAGPDLRLIDAVKNQDAAAVRSLLKQHVNVNAAEGDGATALAWAAHQDDLETVELLIRAGAKVNAANAYGVTPLALAAQNGNPKMVEALLKAGADASAAQTSGVTVLMGAARTGNVDVVKALLAHGAKVNAKDNSRGQTALMWAVAEKHPEVAQLLAKAGADVNACSNGGFTPLLFAAQQGDLDTAKILLGAGANINEAAPEEGTPLLLAVHSGHEELAMFLLDKGAEPNAKDMYGITALHYCIMKGLARLSGVRPISGAEYWYRPNMPNVVKALLEHGADPNVQIAKFPPLPNTRHFKDIDMTPVGATPFLLAATSYDAPIMRMLLAKGADPKLTDIDHNTPLIMAAGFAEGITHAVQRPAQDDKDSLEAVKLLVNDLGADVNETNKIGETPLLGAAYVGANDIIQFLVDKGAKVDAANIYGQTPWSLAAQFMTKGVAKDKDLRPRNGHDATADLLIKLGAKPLGPEMRAQAAAE
jgi:ankyrin repeat protein